ncbi:hypothetical protein AtNW77_Chr4g0299131 [Arabidopsis thaliana]
MLFTYKRQLKPGCTGKRQRPRSPLSLKLRLTVMPRRLRILSLTASHAHTDTRETLLRPAKIEQHWAALLVVMEMRPSTLTQIPNSDWLRGHTGWAEVKPKKTRLKVRKRAMIVVMFFEAIL